MRRERVWCFNPRACVRRDVRDFQPTLYVKTFQSTRLREARREMWTVSATRVVFQSTRLREARPEKELQAYVKDFVSIHAPA